MHEFLVTARCPSGHTQGISFHSPTIDQVQLFAGLLDGTSEGYKYPPGPESVIGKCGICGQPFRCTVEDKGPISPE